MKRILRSLVFPFALGAQSLLASPTAPDSLRTGYVVRDYAAVLPAQTRAELEQRLIRYADSTGVELAVVTVASLHGREVGQVGDSIKNALGVGNKQSQTGILYLIAPAEHKQSIRVGRGMEAYLTDAECLRILNATRPKPSQDLPGAIRARTLAIIRQITPDQPQLALDHAQDEQIQEVLLQEPRERNYAGLILFGLLGVGWVVMMILIRRNEQEYEATADELSRLQQSPRSLDQADPAPGKWRERKRIKFRGKWRDKASKRTEEKGAPTRQESSSSNVVSALIVGSLLSDNDEEPRRSNPISYDFFSSSSSDSGSSFSFGGDSDSGGGGASSSDW